ncbi:MAG: M1 family metallopeptidase, partial [Chlorobiales bacterium]|nr:M1 family metallopeptidase [Chlorobiales bacterium]
YARRWAYKHPQPYDFFNTFEQVLGEDLGWFWRVMLFETWTLDQAIAKVTEDKDSVTVTIEDKGLMPMPVFLKVTYSDGTVEQKQLPVQGWLEGNRTVVAAFRPGKVVRVEIDPEKYLPDIDPANNVWTP